VAKINFFVLFFLFSLIYISYGNNDFYIEPYLQNVTQTSITVQWWTDESEETNRVEYGKEFKYSSDASNDFIESTGKYLHRAVLTDLEPDCSYNYRVCSGSKTGKEYIFHTAVNRNTPFTFAMIGDGRTDNDKIIARHRHICDMAMKEHINLALIAGDEVCTGEQLHWDRYWRQIVTASDDKNGGINFAGTIPIYLVVGNHEIYNGEKTDRTGNLKTSMARFKAYVDNPPNMSKNPDWEERYYSFNYGVATFIVLDTNSTGALFYKNNKYLPAGETPDWEPGSEQYLWMLEELKKAQNNSAFTFIVMHPSPYCRGTHGDPKQVQSGWHLRALDCIFHKYGVDCVLSSHDHLVEHCLTGPQGYEEKMDKQDPNNLNYLVIGNSGEASRYAREGWEQWMSIKDDGNPPYFTTYFYDWEGNNDRCSFLRVVITDKGKGLWNAAFSVIRDDGNIFDEFYIERADPLYIINQ